MTAKKKKIFATFGRTLRREMLWLMPGLGVKRWILLILAGCTLIGVGFAILLLDFYRTAPDTWWLPVLSYLSLRFLSRPLRAIIFGSLGFGLIFLGMWGFNRSILKPFVAPGRNVIDMLARHRKRERAPRIVVIGGGTGQSTLLRGLKEHTYNLTAIVTVADDGGSSGELRRSLGVLPPGDIRSCLTALADDETLMGQLFQYRFAGGNGLSGHAVGNLLISALAEITGSFAEAVAESGRVLAVRGQVLPATLHDVRLAADVQMPDNGKEVRVQGESQIPRTTGRIRRVWLEPAHVRAYPPAVQAILGADLVLVGPGSLYTSILPDLLVPDISEALRVSRALKFYVCNVATQPGETDGFTAYDHLQTIEKHVGGGLFDLVLCNNRMEGKLPEGVEWVSPTDQLQDEFPAYLGDFIDEAKPHRHDPVKLAQTILDLYNERTGPSTYGESLG
ncbi:MAG: uridine diphosphate-N-acetylglucosamine-binding protein YvcK [Anaerolineaceae bacterium]|nr:uridine diphosphate-N-acetylglucosamine-binding protein YvcK [Anaerolineaceae bacterium]